MQDVRKVDTMFSQGCTLKMVHIVANVLLLQDLVKQAL